MIDKGRRERQEMECHAEALEAELFEGRPSMAQGYVLYASFNISFANAR
jgi:hypothetical protein